MLSHKLKKKQMFCTETKTQDCWKIKLNQSEMEHFKLNFKLNTPLALQQFVQSVLLKQMQDFTMIAGFVAPHLMKGVSRTYATSKNKNKHTQNKNARVYMFLLLFFLFFVAQVVVG